MSNKYENYSRDELIERIEELRKQLNNEKYGLYFDRKSNAEIVVGKSQTTIPIIVSKFNLDIINGETNNIIIEGDNFEVLSGLNMINSQNGMYDIIYIDPPYNTGNQDFIYNDKYVDSEDGFRHSKWLKFMESRMVIAKSLLRENGLVFISIDDNEQANLELLCNAIFGEKNKITKFIWEKTQHFGRQKVNYYSNCEYILCYAKQLYDTTKFKLKELLVERINNELLDAPLYNASNPEKTLCFPKGSVKFNLNDGIYTQTNNELYILESPVIVKNNTNINELVLRFRSRWSAETVINEYRKGTTFWVKTESFAIRTIYHDGKTSYVSPKQIIFTNNNNPMVVKSRTGIKVGVNEEATKELSGLLHSNLFSYPKPVSLIKYLISLSFEYGVGDFSKSARVLDFFAGSGTTGQAVLELNNEDGGNRTFTLVTNNENNIMTDVCYPRLKTVITGIRPDGTKYSDGIPANLRYFKSDFIDNSPSKDQSKYDLVEKCNDMLCISEDSFDMIDNSNSYYIYENKHADKLMSIFFDYFNKEQFDKMISKIKNNSSENKIIYLFSLNNEIDSNEKQIILDNIPDAIIKPIPSKMYEIYKKIVDDLKRNY